MIISDKVVLIGISSDKEKKRIKMELERLKMTNIIVVNLRYLNNFGHFPKRYPPFRKIMEKREYFKILFSEREDDIKNLPSSNGWQGRIDIISAGEELKFEKNIIQSYLHWVSNCASISPSEI
ncbi:MAG: hypothetical protein HW401_847 [Parcubacteria group bacterium]|nr:hypothetical protein [Parcubacteria group bacterium]